ncbi:MAG: FAD-dependent oxidoreductase [Phycisphaerales bacterium]|nr:FAD-dependent oxidoreductase [Phycisphaerales bacterium]
MISDTLHAPGSFLDVHQQTFDVLVLGGGYTGLAVALQQRQLGQKVLLVEPRGDLVWESGRAMFTRAGSLDHPLWQQLVREVESRMPVTQPGWLDPALAEVVATKLVTEAGLSCLYYAWPVMLEQSHHQLTSLIVATKSGYRRLVARRFVDATESGTLIRLLNPNLPDRPLEQGIMSAFLQRRTWPADAADRFQPTPWETQRQYDVTVTMLDPALARATLLATLIEDEPARDTMMSHAGVQPYPLYVSGSAMLAMPGVPGNLCMASPSLADESLPSLADRFALGLQASKQLERMTPAEPDRELFNQTIPMLSCSLPDISAQVLVAGGGTGGALAPWPALKPGRPRSASSL